MPSSMLSHLIDRFSSPVENVATEALAYILTSSRVASEALIDICRVSGISLPHDLLFSTQEGDALGGVLDLVGTDSNQNRRLVIESKFWAGLTDRQPVGYLDGMDSQESAILLFLAPTLRVPTLWSELVRRMKMSGRELPAALLGTSDLRFVLFDGGRRCLELATWHSVLNLMEARLVADGDSHTRADIAQLRGLVEKLDSTAFLPVNSEELAPRHARRYTDFITLVREVVVALREFAWFSTEGLRETRQAASFGQYCAIRGFPAQIKFDPGLWGSIAETPMWLDITGPHWAYSAELREQLYPLESAVPQRMYFNGEKYLHIPLFIKTGEEKPSVVHHLIEQIREVAELLAPPADPTDK